MKKLLAILLLLFDGLFPYQEVGPFKKSGFSWKEFILVFSVVILMFAFNFIRHY